MKKMKVLLLVALSAACILSGCSKPEEVPEEIPVQEETVVEQEPVVEEIITDEEPVFVEELPEGIQVGVSAGGDYIILTSEKVIRYSHEDWSVENEWKNFDLFIMELIDGIE
jgi:hypothetical protein